MLCVYNIPGVPRVHKRARLTANLRARRGPEAAVKGHGGGNRERKVALVRSVLSVLDVRDAVGCLGPPVVGVQAQRGDRRGVGVKLLDLFLDCHAGDHVGYLKKKFGGGRDA